MLNIFNRYYLPIFGAILLAVGMQMFSWSIPGWWVYFRSSGWKSVSAMVESAKLKGEQPADSAFRSYRLETLYRYSFQDTEMLASRTFPTDEPNTSDKHGDFYREKLDFLKGQMQASQPVVILVNTANPTESLLFREICPGMFLSLILGTIATGFGLFLVLGGWHTANGLPAVGNAGEPNSTGAQEKPMNQQHPVRRFSCVGVVFIGAIILFGILKSTNSLPRFEEVTVESRNWKRTVVFQQGTHRLWEGWLSEQKEILEVLASETRQNGLKAVPDGYEEKSFGTERRVVEVERTVRVKGRIGKTETVTERQTENVPIIKQVRRYRSEPNLDTWVRAWIFEWGEEKTIEASGTWDDPFWPAVTAEASNLKHPASGAIQLVNQVTILEATLKNPQSQKTYQAWSMPLPTERETSGPLPWILFQKLKPGMALKAFIAGDDSVVSLREPGGS